MLAKFENKLRSEIAHTFAATYKSLQNLPHWHIDHELVYVSKGAVELMVNNKIYTLTEGMSAFLKSEDTHCMRGSKGSLTHVIKTTCSAVDAVTRNKQLLSPVLEGEYSLDKIFRSIMDEILKKDEYSGIIADSVVTMLVAGIFRTEPSEAAACPADDKHKQLLRWISDNFSHVSFEEAAGYMNFSKSHFARYFQNISGMKFTRYINTLKISAAVEKIAEGTMNMTEISIACGFGTIRNFNRIFKEFTGFTPKTMPKDFHFVYKLRNNSDTWFDPTLNCTDIVE